LIALMRSSGIGKYNNAPDLSDDDTLGRDKPLILVVDQTYGDFSIPGGGLCEADFISMLDAALAENPDADVRVRIHPDCINGHKKSCLLDAALARGVALENRHVSWASLAGRARRVYVGTSQAGLEALIQGVPVTCFGLPFYAGWGLTDDRLSIPRRQARPTLDQLVAAAYIRYCRYVNPLTDQRCDVLTVARQLARQKQQDSQFAGAITVVGVPRRRQPAIRSLLDSRWGQVKFTHYRADLMKTVSREAGKVLVWSAHEPDDLSSRAATQGVPLWRIRTGNTPTSLILKRNDSDEQQLVQVRGMPCSHQQALEHHAQPDPGLLDSCPRYRQVRRYLKGMLSL
jgi:capsular polysaccharide export protein